MDAEVRFFHCGNGDTILIRGGDEWALVDANLTARSGAGERLRKALTDNDVKRLRFVCVTHFDADHIRGLGRFLREHFGPNGKDRVAWEIEQVVIPLRVSALFWETLFCTEEQYKQFLDEMDDATVPFAELFDVLRDMGKRDHRIFQSYDPRTQLVSRNLNPASSPLGPWDVWFLGPSVEIEGRYTLGFATDWGLGAAPSREWPRLLRAAVERNETSRIVALYHRLTGDTVLLTGDATCASIREALLQWENVKQQAKLDPRLTFRLVKASHHGAWTDRESDNCHHEELYTRHSSHEHSHVAISCRDLDDHHPHPNMINCIRDEVLRSVSTGVPTMATTQGAIRRRGGGMPIGKIRQSATALDVLFRFNKDGCMAEGGHLRTGAGHPDQVRS